MFAKDVIATRIAHIYYAFRIALCRKINLAGRWYKNLIAGTDDTLLFGGTAKSNFNDFLRFLSNTENLSHKEIKAHQSTFRFTAG